MFIKILERVQLTIGVLSLTIFFTAIIIQIFTRHYGIPIIWTEEVANYSFIWAVFMGAAVMVNRREHFNFDFILKKLKGKPRVYLRIINDSVLIMFNAAIFYYGLEAVNSFWNYNWASLPMLKMGYVWISLPIMALTMSIYSLAHLVKSIKELMAKEVSE
jgi:TRAP-type C4-dicarboxylate transport system permease small subunit